MHACSSKAWGMPTGCRLYALCKSLMANVFLYFCISVFPVVASAENVDALRAWIAQCGLVPLRALNNNNNNKMHFRPCSHARMQLKGFFNNHKLHLPHHPKLPTRSLPSKCISVFLSCAHLCTLLTQHGGLQSCSGHTQESAPLI